MSYWVYILKCSDESLYTGLSGDFKKRISEHKKGLVPFSKNRLPFSIIYKDEFKTRTEAAKREHEIKGWRREKKLALANSLR